MQVKGDLLLRWVQGEKGKSPREARNQTNCTPELARGHPVRAKLFHAPPNGKILKAEEPVWHSSTFLSFKELLRKEAPWPSPLKFSEGWLGHEKSNLCVGRIKRSLWHNKLVQSRLNGPNNWAFLGAHFPDPFSNGGQGLLAALSTAVKFKGPPYPQPLHGHEHSIKS